MQMDWIRLIETFGYSGLAGLGFGILFNIPKRIIKTVFMVAAIAGILKFGSMMLGLHIIQASFLGATAAGILAIPLSGRHLTSPFIVSIPAVIPMIPGYFGYKTFIGIMGVALNNDPTYQIETIPKLLNSGLNMIFILASLTAGVALPWLILRQRASLLRNAKSKHIV